MTTNVFDYVKSINKKDGQLEIGEEYIPYIINKALSTYFDCVYYAEVGETLHNVSKQMQYDFYYNAVPRQPKRFAKYPKQKNDKYLLIVQEYYKCSIQNAKEIVNILDQDTLKKIEMKLDKGGKINGK